MIFIKISKKILATVLAVLMAVSMMPFTVFADNIQCPECGSTDVEYRFDDWYACNNCSEWFEYTPSGPPCPECGSTNTQQMSGEYYMCLDCNENFRYVDPSDSVEGDGSENDPYMVGSYNALVNLCNSFWDEWYEDYAPYVQLKANIEFSNVIMTLSYGINLNLDTYHINSGQMETRFEGGIFTITGGTGSYISKLRIQDYATVNLNSGTLNDVTVDNSTLVINGGSITEDFETDDYAVIEMNNGTVCEIDMDDTSELLMTGGTVENFIHLNNQSTSIISGGTIPGLTLNGSAECVVSGGTFTAVNTVVNGGTLTVSGGDFSGQYGGILNYGGAVEVTGGTFGCVTNASGTMALKGGNYEKRPSYYNNDELGYLETYVPNGFNVEETTNYFTVVSVPVHTIIWKNWDGTTLETDAEVEEGETPTYDGETPTKPEDETNTYTFSGWNPTVSVVTGEATYVAQFTPVAKFSVFVKKLTGGTITVPNVTGLTTVAQLKDLLVTETGVPASAMRLIFAGKQLEDDKTLGEYNIQKESTLHLVIRTYTITWKSDEATIIDTTNVAYGETPTHAAPADYEDADYTYTFAGWTPEVTAVTGEATYTATYTATAKDVKPTATVTEIDYADVQAFFPDAPAMDVVYQFVANNDGNDKYRSYNADFVVSFDKAVPQGAVKLYGQYGAYPITECPITKDLAANEEYRLLKDSMQMDMTYQQILDLVQTFYCGAKYTAAAAGATMTIKLAIYETAVDPQTGLPEETGTEVEIEDAEQTDTAPALPQATVTDITNTEENELGLDAAYKFEAPAGETIYDDEYCDFIIRFDQDVTSDDIELWGKYGAYDWTNLASEASGDAYTFEAGKDYYLLRDVIKWPMTYAQIRQIGTFYCGVNSYYGANGVTMDVELALYEEPAEGEEPAPVVLDDEEFVAPDKPAPAVDEVSITTADEVDVNVYLGDTGEEETVTYTFNASPDEEADDQETVTVDFASLPTVGGKKQLTITVAPAQIRDNIDIDVKNAAGDVVRSYENYSVAAYCDEIAAGDYTDAVKTLAKSVLDYGKAASAFFGYNTAAFTDDYNFDGFTFDTTGFTAEASGITINEVRYVATSVPSLRFKVDMAEDEAATLTATTDKGYE
ncbi:MAG: hypothetical protein IJI47_05920, partial [Eubacterium sp.]|nr:hypothetical protein [Eubacterium sp.]